MELKPCPFCGGEAVIETIYVDTTQWFYPKCLRCNAEMNNLEPIRERAVKAWNNAPDFRVKQIIRCRDCENGRLTKNARGEPVVECCVICGLCQIPQLMDLDWFCADAKGKGESV